MVTPRGVQRLLGGHRGGVCILTWVGDTWMFFCSLCLTIRVISEVETYGRAEAAGVPLNKCPGK